MGSISELDDARLLARVRELVCRGNEVEADLVAHLGEIDARRLYLEQGCTSMFVYCVRVLHFAEGVAYKRIQAARAARAHPELLDSLRRGDLHLTAIGLLAPKLTKERCAELIEAARHKSADEIRRLLADREPRAAVPSVVRKLPDPAPARSHSVPQAPGASAPCVFPPRPGPRATEPLGAQRYRVQFTADSETHAQLQELRALMRHQIPDGDVGKILTRAISSLLAQVRKRKLAEAARPTSALASPDAAASRHIPARVRRAVWSRDCGRCTYTSLEGRRCDAREFVEFDHVVPWARTRSHSVSNITLRCRAHNQLRARRDFGARHMAQFGRGVQRPELDSNPVL